MAKKQTRVNPAVLKDLVEFMNSPAGGGDMLKSVYDVGNTGTVDEAKDSDMLDGQHASAFAAASHAIAHQDGGPDELNVAGLSGELADPQPAKAHTHPGGEITSQVGDAHTVDGSHAADFAPASKGVTNGDSHDHIGGDGAAIAEGALSLSDVATGDVNTSRHGLCPKAPNDTTKFLRGDGTWQTPAAGGLGYSLNVLATTSAMTGGGTHYFGGQAYTLTTLDGAQRIYIPKAGTIKVAYIHFYAVTIGTGENISVYIRKNSTTDTLVATVGNTNQQRIFSNTGLNISVAQGDFIEIKIVCPSWATTPLQNRWSGVLYVE